MMENTKIKKRAPKNTGHIRKKGNVWEGQYWLKGQHKSVFGNTEEECRAKLNMVQAKIIRGTYVDGSMMPLWVYLDEWHIKYTQIGAGTHPNYDTYIHKHIYESRIGSIPLKKLSLNDFSDFFKEKECSGRLDGKTGGLSPKTLRNMRNMISEALDYAVNYLKYIESNPILGLKTPKVKQPEIKVFDLNSQIQLEKAALTHENPNALMVLIDLYTGLRIGELCGLQWSDFGANCFRVTKSIERRYKIWAENNDDYCLLDVPQNPNNKTALYLCPPKTEKGKRTVYLTEQAIAGFDKIRKYQIEQKWYRPNGFVFLNSSGYPFASEYYYNIYRDVLERAGVEYRNFHTLRHTFATRAFELQFDIPTLADILGHAQRSTTENMYGHSLDDTKQKAMSKFNGMGKFSG